MAKQKSTTFYEVVFKGKPKMVKAFLEGLILGHGKGGTVFYSFSDGIHHEGKAEHLAELVGFRATDCHVVVDDGTSDLLRDVADGMAQATGLEIARHRKVRSAAMDFRYRTYAPRYNRQIMDLLDDLPAGLRLRDFEHDEKSDPDAEGVEAYTAVHDFESHGSGTVTGPVDLLVAFRHRCEELPLMELGEIELRT